MREGTAALIHRADYQQPAYWIRKVELTFDLDPAKTIVGSKLQIERNHAVPHGPLRLHGEELCRKARSRLGTRRKMKNQSVQALLEDIRLVSEQNYEIVEAVRALVQKTFETTSEEIKYGGILFRSGVQFGGVFAYKTHVTVEFRNGAKITDTFGFLEGSGKGRRHVKLMSVDQIKDKKLAQYLSLALQASKQDDS